MGSLSECASSQRGYKQVSHFLQVSNSQSDCFHCISVASVELYGNVSCGEVWQQDINVATMKLNNNYIVRQKTLKERLIFKYIHRSYT